MNNTANVCITDSSRYSCVAIALHWTIAAIILFLLFSGYIQENAETQEQKDFAMQFFQFHKALGILILVLSLFRLHWRLNNTPPALPAIMPQWQVHSANIVHYLLYFFMIAIPLTGWIMSSAYAKYPISIFGLFEWPFIPLKHLENAQIIGGFTRELHTWFAYSMLAMLVAHVGAALYHHFVQKDNVLRRMLPSCKSCTK